MNIFDQRRIVYTAQSRHLYYCKMFICKYVLEHEAVPINPFNAWGYYLYELVDRDLVRLGNNNLVRIVDETWVFGPIADGVLAEIQYSMELQKPLKFFTAGSRYEDIHPLSIESLEFEPEALISASADSIKAQISSYLIRLGV